MTQFSFQLYSARNFPPLADVFVLLARLGYKRVEGYGGLYEDLAALKGLLDEHGLMMPTGHFGLDQLRDKASTLDIAKTLGIETIYCPFIPEEFWKQSDAEWAAFASELAEFGKVYTGEGFGFGWHNHHFEFWPTESGRTPMEIILETAPDIDWEMDVAWIKRGDGDPVEWIEKYGQRVTAVHVKDIAPEGEAADEDGWADVGHGTMGWDSLLPLIRQKTKARHFVMEHDNPADLERFAARSIAAAGSY